MSAVRTKAPRSNVLTLAQGNVGAAGRRSNPRPLVPKTNALIR